MSEITVIFDGECELCKSSIRWVERKVAINALSFHTTDLTPFNLTHADCAQEVIAITNKQTYKGAAAVALLLKARGNRILSTVVTASGPLGRTGYHWVATHRNSAPIQLLRKFLDA